MRKSLVLNFEILRTFNISVEEFLFLYNIYQEKEDINTLNIDLNKLQEQKLIKIIKDEKIIYILREKATKLVEFSIIEIESSLMKDKKTIKKSDRAINEDINNRMDEFRAK